MKKIIYTLTIALCAGFFSSCDDALDGGAGSTIEAEMLFSSEILAEQAMYGILISFAETNSYRGRFLPYYGFNTDSEIYNDTGTDKGALDEKAQVYGYATPVDNTQLNGSASTVNCWATMYEGIERANICIEGLRTYGDVENNAVMAQLLGECLTLRAVLYADLVKAWGDVPARFEPVTSETTYIEKSDRDVIYKQLLIDLEEAAELMAWPNATTVTSTVQRVNKAFAKGLRARIALHAAGYSQRPDGTLRKSTDPELNDQDLYKIVRDECVDIINSSTLTLTGFEETFRNLSGENTDAGNESMWEIPFGSGRGRVAYTFAIKHNAQNKYTTIAAGGTILAAPNLYYDYDPDDVRRDITCIPYYWDVETGTDRVFQDPRNVATWYIGKYRFEWMSRVASGSTDDGLNWLYMRYADVILMAAEAINELDGPTTEAKNYLKMVRSRAFSSAQQAEKVDAYIDALTTQDDFRNAIMDERKWEFTGEAIRKADLIRWNKLGEKMKENKEKLYRLQKREGEYADYPDKIYYTWAEDDETVIIYGLNKGDTDEIGATLVTAEGEAYENKNWFTSSSGYTLTDEKIEGIYFNDPDEYQFWPIFQYYISTSNGTLKNDYNY